MVRHLGLPDTMGYNHQDIQGYFFEFNSADERQVKSNKLTGTDLLCSRYWQAWSHAELQGRWKKHCYTALNMLICLKVLVVFQLKSTPLHNDLAWSHQGRLYTWNVWTQRTRSHCSLIRGDNFMSTFSPQIAILVRPLLTKEADFLWLQHYTRTFKLLIGEVWPNYCLSYLDSQKHVYLECCACKVNLSANLL